MLLAFLFAETAAPRERGQQTADPAGGLQKPESYRLTEGQAPGRYVSLDQARRRRRLHRDSNVRRFGRRKVSGNSLKICIR
jgi:hypothetical protein